MMGWYAVLLGHACLGGRGCLTHTVQPIRGRATLLAPVVRNILISWGIGPERYGCMVADIRALARDMPAHALWEYMCGHSMGQQS